MVDFVEQKVPCTGKWSILSNKKHSVLVNGRFYRTKSSLYWYRVDFVEPKVLCTGKWSILSDEKHSVLVQGQFCPSIQTELKKGRHQRHLPKTKIIYYLLNYNFYNVYRILCHHFNHINAINFYINNSIISVHNATVNNSTIHIN